MSSRGLKQIEDWVHLQVERLTRDTLCVELVVELEVVVARQAGRQQLYQVST